jgi:hypothetical protein
VRRDYEDTLRAGIDAGGGIGVPFEPGRRVVLRAPG